MAWKEKSLGAGNPVKDFLDFSPSMPQDNPSQFQNISVEKSFLAERESSFL